MYSTAVLLFEVAGIVLVRHLQERERKTFRGLIACGSACVKGADKGLFELPRQEFRLFLHIIENDVHEAANNSQRTVSTFRYRRGTIPNVKQLDTGPSFPHRLRGDQR